MTTHELIEKFSKTPTQHKAIGLALVSVFFGVLFYFVFYSDVDEQSKRLDREIRQLQQDKVSYEEKRVKYDRFRAEVNTLLEEQKELIKVLPVDAEIPAFLQSVHAQGELSGLNILTFEPMPEIMKNFYAQIPVKMVISGTYHQINKFFYSVGQLKRIVNIQDLTLGNPVPTEHGVYLKAEFVASTFRFVAPVQPPPPPPGAPPPPRAPHG
jgi:type IV pilus assembly protein PilO